MKHKPDIASQIAQWVFIAFVTAAVSGLIWAFSYSMCYARDRGQYNNVDPATKSWVQGLKNDDGEGCCATADGYPAEVEWDTAKSKYRVRIDGEWYDVPDKAVIKEPNRLGYAVVWYYPINDANGKMTPYIRCFLPGAGG